MTQTVGVGCRGHSGQQKNRRDACPGQLFCEGLDSVRTLLVSRSPLSSRARATITDQILDMHDRIVGRMLARLARANPVSEARAGQPGERAVFGEEDHNAL